MKKILLALLMALPCLGLAQVATQKVNNTAVIYNSTSPVTFGANFTGTGTDYLLNNQTLTGNGSIINRVLGDARYAAFANGFFTNASYFYSTGTTQNFYNITVRNDATVFGATTLSNTLIFGTLRVSNVVNFIQTGVTWGFDGTRFHMGTNDGSGFFDWEVNLKPSPTNPNYVQFGAFRSGTLSMEGNNDVQVVIDRNNNSANDNQFIIRKDATNGPILYVINEAFNATNYGNLTVTNTFSAKNYQVSGTSGFTAVITNSVGTVTNIMAYSSGILTNLTRIP